jgi:hypothetical protein
MDVTRQAGAQRQELGVRDLAPGWPWGRGTVYGAVTSLFESLRVSVRVPSLCLETKMYILFLLGFCLVFGQGWAQERGQWPRLEKR